MCLVKHRLRHTVSIVYAHPGVFLLVYSDFCWWVWKQLHSLPETRDGTGYDKKIIKAVLILKENRVFSFQLFLGPLIKSRLNKVSSILQVPWDHAQCPDHRKRVHFRGTYTFISFGFYTTLMSTCTCTKLMYCHGDLLIVDSFLDDSLLSLPILTPAHPHTTHLTVGQREVNKA